jgi:hypothetical protein
MPGRQGIGVFGTTDDPQGAGIYGYNTAGGYAGNFQQGIIVIGNIDAEASVNIAKTLAVNGGALNVTKNAPGALGPAITLTNTGGEQNAATAIDMSTYPPVSTGTYNPSARIQAVDVGNFTNDIVFFANKSGAGNSGLVETMRITSAGTLKVANDITLANADCAEEFDVADSLGVEPGTVMVIGDDEALRPSSQPYDPRVAGVVSGGGDYKPALLLDRRDTSRKRSPVALVGKVCCKVDTQYGQIKVGDLLTTSPTPGHAMKATDRDRAFGAVIGKALQPLMSGQGLVAILVALQ